MIVVVLAVRAKTAASWISRTDDMRSVTSFAAGGAAFVGGLGGRVTLLPYVTPYDLLRCSPSGGGTQCFGSLNLVYPAVFVLSMVGGGLAFYGLFGRGFVLSPLFILGILVLGWGLAGAVFGYEGQLWCRSQSLLSCIVYHPDFARFLVGGLTLIGGNVCIWWMISTTRRGKR